MSKFNLGIVKTSILTNMNENSSIKGFINLLKESEFLKLELSVFDNIEKKYIPDNDLAIKYIDENINLIKEKGYTKESFEIENRKFLPLVEGIQISNTKKKTLYENIHVMIYESLNGKKPTNVNKLHDSFVYVLEYIKNNNNKEIIETVAIPSIPKEIIQNDFLLKRAIHEFNDKYSELLNEDEIVILKSIVNENKEYSFTSIKESTLNSLVELKGEIISELNSTNDINEQREIDIFRSKIEESINNIEKLSYNETTYLNDVVDLVNLKKELSS